MVLSLGFILAFIGAAVALLIGILIFSEVSDAIICPAGTGGGTNATGFVNTGSLGAAGDAAYFEGGSPSTFVSIAGIINEGVIQNGTSSLDTQGEVRFGVVGSTFNFLHTSGAGSNLTSINFWINGDVDGNPEYPLLTSYNEVGGQETGIMLYTLGSNTEIRVKEDDQTTYFGVIKNSIPADDSNWHMVTVMYDKGNTTGPAVVGCIDAVCQNTLANNLPWLGVVTNHEEPLTLGSDSHRGSFTENTFDVDDLTIWDGWQLSQSEINTMWNGGAGSSGSAIAPGAQALHISFDLTVPSGGGGSVQGTEECENAKDTAWTVIGILPVALFFALFAIFGALGRNN